MIPDLDHNAFAVEVVSTDARIPDDADALIDYSDEVTPHPEVTTGKAGRAVV